LLWVNKAKALLEDETLNKAFAEIEKRFVDRWKTTTDTASGTAAGWRST
jgi:hypothetical protein